MLVAAAAQTDKGSVRADNEDAVGSVEPTDPTERERKGLLYAVADGMGGANAGEVASATAVRCLLDEYYAPSNASRVEPALRHAIQIANLRVHDLSQKHPEYRGMGTTLSALALAGATAYVAHVGDSRIYRVRNDALTLLTEDHTEVAQLVRMKLVKPEMVNGHPNRNVLTRTVGQQLLLRPDFNREAVLPGDTFLLCTDGVWSEVRESEFIDAANDADPGAACGRIIQLCLDRQCADNISVQVIRVIDVDQAAQQAHHRPTLINTLIDRLVR